MLLKLEEAFNGIEFDLVYGGQPFYFYLASIEWGGKDGRTKKVFWTF